MLKEALQYLAKGLSVIPAEPRGKKPLIPWKEFQTRLATADEVNSWFAKWPNANIGIVTGKISGITVVDVEKGGKFNSPPTLVAKTGGGGWHYYFKYAPEVDNFARIQPLVDIRGNGGFVICSPSVHPSGNKYEWELVAPLADFPYHYFGFKNTNWEEIIDGVKQGSRNESAAKYIGLRVRRFPEKEWESFVWPDVKQWNERNNPPLPEKELRATFKSICERQRENVIQEKNTEKDYKENISYLSFSELLDLSQKELEQTRPEDVISFGYPFLDEKLTGIFPGELVVVGGETGSGKTVLCTNIMYKVSRFQKRKCTLFALEDRLEDYGIKALYFELGRVIKEQIGPDIANYSWNNYRKNNIDDPNFPALLAIAKENLRNDLIQFAKVDTIMTIELLELAIEDCIKKDTDLFLIDHLHYFNLFHEKKSKADYIEEVMVKLRTIQRRTGARIILIVHYRKLNGDKKPNLDSFKDSISIVQNANYVINLWRDRSQDGNQYETHFYIPKSRNPNGESVIKTMFDPITSDYISLDNNWEIE